MVTISVFKIKQAQSIASTLKGEVYISISKETIKYDFILQIVF